MALATVWRQNRVFASFWKWSLSPVRLLQDIGRRNRAFAGLDAAVSTHLQDSPRTTPPHTQGCSARPLPHRNECPLRSRHAFVLWSWARRCQINGLLPMESTKIGQLNHWTKYSTWFLKMGSQVWPQTCCFFWVVDTNLGAQPSAWGQIEADCGYCKLIALIHLNFKRP